MYFDLIMKSFIISQVVAFFLMVCFKQSYISYLQIHTVGLLNKTFNCVFCMSFWLSVIIVVIYFLITGNFIWFALFLSPNLNRLQF